LSVLSYTVSLLYGILLFLSTTFLCCIFATQLLLC
jgi:hypothetical protein